MATLPTTARGNAYEGVEMEDFPVSGAPRDRPSSWHGMPAQHLSAGTGADTTSEDVFPPSDGGRPSSSLSGGGGGQYVAPARTPPWPLAGAGYSSE